MELRLRHIGAAAVLTFGLAACATGGGAQPTPTSSSPSSSPAPCPVGDWRSTQVAATGSAAGATFTFQGGGGVTMTVAPDGAVKADFTSMQPITFTGQVAAVQVAGEFSYKGPISGTVQLGNSASPPLTTSMAPTTSTAPTTSMAPTTGSSSMGTPWHPVGQVVFTDLHLTIKVTQPVSATIVDNVKVSEVTGAQTTQAGNAVDLQPLLRDGDYRCEADNLIITLKGDVGPTVTWTFARA